MALVIMFLSVQQSGELLPNSKMDLSLTPGMARGPFCLVQFSFAHTCVGFLLVRWFSPTVKKYECWGQMKTLNSI